MEKVVPFFKPFTTISYFKKNQARKGPFWIGQSLEGFEIYLNLFEFKF
jgi:hypothetical protein